MDTDAPESGLSDRALTVLTTVMGAGALLVSIDATIVGVGLAQITASLDSTLAVTEWVGSAYLLAVTAAIPLAGWAVDRFGARRLWLGGIAVFTLASVLCALATAPWQLIGARVLQGLGGGVLEPTLLTVLPRVAGPSRTGRALGYAAAPISLGPVLGPVLGGGILAAGSWPWLFLVNVPLGAAVFVASRRRVPAAALPGAPRPLDLRGVATLTPGVAGIVLALSQAAVGGSPVRAGVLVPLLVGLGLLVAFWMHARRAAHPLVDVRALRTRGFAAGVAAVLVVGAELFSLILLIPLFHQRIGGATVFQAGLLFVPFGVGAFAGAQLAARLTDRCSLRLLALIGVLAAGVGTAAYLPLVGLTPWAGAVALLAIGVGLPFAAQAAMVAIYRVLPGDRASTATTALFLVNQFGGALGIAAATLLLERAGFGAVFVAQTVLAAVAAVVVLALPGRPVR